MGEGSGAGKANSPAESSYGQSAGGKSWIKQASGGGGGDGGMGGRGGGAVDAAQKKAVMRQRGDKVGGEKRRERGGGVGKGATVSKGKKLLAADAMFLCDDALHEVRHGCRGFKSTLTLGLPTSSTC